MLRRLRRLARIYDAEPQFLLRVRDDRERRRARARSSPVEAGDRRRSGHVCASRARGRHLEPSPPRCRARAAGEPARRRGASSLPAHLARPADDLLREEPQGGGADPPLRRRARGHRDRANRLAPYRAGYTPEQRREIERRLVEGELLGVTATDALELGIDIGLLDCAISVGFPGTVASLRQQWGRAGQTRARPRRSSSRATTHSTSSSRASPTRCSRAASRRRSSTTRTRASSTRTSSPPRSRRRSTTATRRRSAPRRCAAPQSCRSSSTRRPGYVWKGRDYPAARVSLRSGDAEAFTVVDGETGSLLGLVERDRAYSTVHEGAVYLHLGEQYLVESLSLEDRVAVVRAASRRLVHAGEEGVGDDDRVERASERDASASSSTSAGSP